ncbi:hypothetical protein, partial [Neobacillus drentensis]|uniref:hypothetical protein n=1 Tax=Neobacillus drentensis TaxID=220684 RepID=UPI003003879E
ARHDARRSARHGARRSVRRDVPRSVHHREILPSFSYISFFIHNECYLQSTFANKNITFSTVCLIFVQRMGAPRISCL